MLTLGINAVFHDSAACLVRDGHVIAAAEEERFTGVKHGKRPEPFSTYQLPFNAIAYCLDAGGVGLAQVDHVAYSFDPALLLGGLSGEEWVRLPLEPSAQTTAEGWESVWDPLFLSSIVNAPRQLTGGAPHHLRRRFEGAERDRTFRWHFVEHHTAHAASASLASPFTDAAVLTLDGRGERATTSYSLAQGTTLTRLGAVEMPHSLGLLYEEVTDYLGFLRSSDEYKVMALASYGRPQFVHEFRDIVRLEDRGQYRIEPLGLEQRFGPRRERGAELTQRHQDVAHSLQVVLEETALELTGWLHGETGARDLCLAGGVALNCVMNARLRDEGPFGGVWVQPAAGDAGTALGAALLIDARERGAVERAYLMEDAYLGPAYAAADIEAFLREAKASYRRPADLAGAVADLLVGDSIVGWFQGRMEFGPRALGARSILASPLNAENQARLNAIKDREDFRPVAPAVLEEEAGAWFEPKVSEPFMTFIERVRPEVADRIPAVRHVDGTARIQTVARGQNAAYYDLIRAFGARTGVPVLINTSFNTRGKPIVCTPQDALATFWTSPLDALAIGPFLLEKPR